MTSTANIGKQTDKVVPLVSELEDKTFPVLVSHSSLELQNIEIRLLIK